MNRFSMRHKIVKSAFEKLPEALITSSNVLFRLTNCLKAKEVEPYMMENRKLLGNPDI